MWILLNFSTSICDIFRKQIWPRLTNKKKKKKKVKKQKCIRVFRDRFTSSGGNGGTDQTYLPPTRTLVRPVGPEAHPSALRE